ncbi:deoxyribonuclease -related protein [Phlyctema vagabunda]|uniref:Deoxyribonuclease -related protein n=1 Tax=Phlyctema vagabunda TaxID=108571 RepID=A0ABR4P1C4_9HELO
MITFSSTLSGLGTRFIDLIITLAPLIASLTWLAIRDVFYSISNAFLSKRPVHGVVNPDQPGYHGMWPQYKAAIQGKESRSPCPALNTLANHGILPRDGRHITYAQISNAIQHAYNLSPTLAEQLTASAFLVDQGRGWIDLYDLNALNVVQHDASFTRPDIAFCPDQSYAHPDLVERFLSHASDSKSVSLEDLSYFSGVCRAESTRTNGQSSLTWSFLHKFFGSGNCALMYSVFGGNVKDLRIWLTEERFPDGWEPKNREALGHTIGQAQITTLAIEFNINERQQLRQKKIPVTRVRT